MQNEVLKSKKKLKDGQRQQKHYNNLCTDMGNINATTPQGEVLRLYILCLYVP